MIYSIDDATEFKNIYKNLDSYMNLCLEDRKFYDILFPILLFQDSDIYSDNYLCQRFKNEITKKPMSKSTLQKRLRRLASASLIHKWDERDFVEGRWTTVARHIQLDPVTFSFMKMKSKEGIIATAREEAFNKRDVVEMYNNETPEEYAIRTGKLEVLYE